MLTITKSFWYSANVLALLFCTSSCAGGQIELPKRGYYSANPNDYSLDGVVRPEIDEVMKVIDKKALVGFSWIDMPLYRVIVIKSENELCAVKFFSYKRENDAIEPTTFNSGEESFEAEIEISKSKLTHENFVGFKSVKKEKLSTGPAIGIGKISVRDGTSVIKCGSSRILWQYPTALMFFGKDKTTLLAPTSFVDIKAITSLPLNWYGYEEGRKYKEVDLVEN